MVSFRWKPSRPTIDAGLTEGLDKEAAAVIDVVNGEISAISTFDKSISVHSTGDNLENVIGSVVSPDFDFFADCNLAYNTAPVSIEIAPNSVVTSPILIRHHTSFENLAWFPRVFVHAGENSEATVIEHQSSPLLRDESNAVHKVTAPECQHAMLRQHASKTIHGARIPRNLPRNNSGVRVLCLQQQLHMLQRCHRGLHNRPGYETRNQVI